MRTNRKGYLNRIHRGGEISSSPLGVQLVSRAGGIQEVSRRFQKGIKLVGGQLVGASKSGTQEERHLGGL